MITDLNKCDFRQIDVYYKEQSEKRKAMSKDEKLAIKVNHFICLVFILYYVIGGEGSRAEEIRIRIYRWT